MKFNDKNFYLAETYVAKKISLPIIFYHIPKCGGTTFCNILHNLNTIKSKKSVRIKGALTGGEGVETAYENFHKNKEDFSNQKIDFIYGHFQYSLKKYFNEYFSITTIRDPIERCISHYNMMVRRNTIKKETNIEECFIKKIIPNNIIINTFSSKNPDDDYVNEQKFEIAKNILINEIDLVFKIEDLNKLLVHVISASDMPNVLFQKIQTSPKNYFIKTKKNLDAIFEYNKYDIKLYNFLVKNKVFKEVSKKVTRGKQDNFFIFSASIKFNDKFVALMNLQQFNDLKKFMLDNDFNIINI